MTGCLHLRKNTYITYDTLLLILCNGFFDLSVKANHLVPRTEMIILYANVFFGRYFTEKYNCN